MNSKNIVIVGMQWGDEGKGKLVDALSNQMDYVVRFQGGNNAGHTVLVGKEKFALHLLPSGAVSEKARCVIGPGVVVNPEVLLFEIESIEKRGKSMKTLCLDERAHVILPYHIEEDKKQENALTEKIGTTLRGIGPCYQDKFARLGVRIIDLLSEKRLSSSLKRRFEARGNNPKTFETMLSWGLSWGQKLKSYIQDTTLLLDKANSQNQRILFEGAQAMMLDIDYGTYPFVTSSSPTPAGAAIGAGVSPFSLGKAVGVMKAYCTRVGEGAFPTELLDASGDNLRKRGNEFGTTTGRPRRTGHLDLVVAKHAVRLGGLSSVAVTKLDVLSSLKTLKVAIGYEREGERIEHIPSYLDEVKPIYQEFEGFDEDITHAKKLSDLPKKAQDYLSFIESYLGVPISMVSVGPERMQSLFLKDF